MVIVFHSSFYEVADLQHIHGITRIFFLVIAYLWLGVPIFFVISGYCITATCDSMRRKAETVGTYLWRRYRRIFPPFWILSVLSVAALLIAKVNHESVLFTDNIHPIASPVSLSLSQWIGNLSLTESWRSSVFGAPQHYFLGHAWSLCYEEQFYVVCGLLLFLVPNAFFRGAAYITFGVVALAGSAAFMRVSIAGFFFDGRWLMFALGILVYWIVNYATADLGARLKRLLLLGASLSLLLFLIGPVRRLLLAGIGIEVVSALLFAVVLVHLHPLDSHIANNWVLTPISWCGSMCYSLYLSHWIVVKPVSNWLWHHGLHSAGATLLVTIPICLAASVIVARVFYLFVERHFLNTHSVSKRNHNCSVQVASRAMAAG
jgi:peptidoglycan/LPS O-acetylase OafA/YrhL